MEEDVAAQLASQQTAAFQALEVEVNGLREEYIEEVACCILRPRSDSLSGRLY